MDRIPSLHRRIKKLQKTRLQEGTILSFTTVRHPPAGFGTEPYTVALIQHADGTKVMAQLTRTTMVPSIGARVIPHMRKIRTMQNGLIVNDLKYEVVVRKTEPMFTVTAYVLAVSGPSGVGKTTIAKSLLSFFTAYAEQVPMVTTRKARKTDTEPYHHVKQEEFQRMVESGEIVSSTELPSGMSTNFYGYRKKDIDAVWAKGKLPIVVTETKLLQGLVKSLGRRAVLSCGLLPPGASRRSKLSSLLHRLRSRGHHTEEQIEHRMKTAERDLQAFSEQAHLFDHVLVNDKLETCVETIRELVVAGN